MGCERPRISAHHRHATLHPPWSRKEVDDNLATASCRNRGEGVISAVRKWENDMAKIDIARGRRVTLLIATRKGLWQLTADATRRKWRLTGPHFLGHVVHHCVADPRDGRTLLAAARTGHLGPTTVSYTHLTLPTNREVK